MTSPGKFKDRKSAASSTKITKDKEKSSLSSKTGISKEKIKSQGNGSGSPSSPVTDLGNSTGPAGSVIPDATTASINISATTASAHHISGSENSYDYGVSPDAVNNNNSTSAPTNALDTNSAAINVAATINTSSYITDSYYSNTEIPYNTIAYGNNLENGYLVVSELSSRLSGGIPIGGRPVACTTVPAYSPVLDLLFNTRGKVRVDKASAPIKMVLSGSVGRTERHTYLSQELINFNRNNLKQSGLSNESRQYRSLLEEEPDSEDRGTRSKDTRNSRSTSSRDSRSSNTGRRQTNTSTSKGGSNVSRSGNNVARGGINGANGGRGPAGSARMSSHMHRMFSMAQHETLLGSMGKRSGSDMLQRLRAGGGGLSFSFIEGAEEQRTTGGSGGNRTTTIHQNGQSTGTLDGQLQGKEKFDNENSLKATTSRNNTATTDSEGNKLRVTSTQQLRMQNVQLTTSEAAYRLTMAKLDGQATLQGGFQIVAQHSEVTPVRTLLKRLYDKERIEEMDEDEAMNATLLVFSLSDNKAYTHSTQVLQNAMDIADEMGINDKELRKCLTGGAMLKDIGEMGIYLSQQNEDKIDKIANFMGSKNLRDAALLHNIGETQIPLEIRRKGTKLTEEEYQILRMHPIIGEEMIYPIESLRHLCPTIRGHHERWDGKGYPDGLSGTSIPLAARILAISDAYEELVTEQPYKNAVDPKVARDIINAGSGSHFDPDCVAAFNRILDRRFPQTGNRRPSRLRARAHAQVEVMADAEA